MRTQIGTEQTEKLAHSFSGRFRPTRARAIGLTPLAFTLLLWGVFFVCPAARAQTNKSLVKAADNPTVYWLQNGKYYPVFASTLDTMQSNGMPGWSWSSIMTLPSIILPRGPAQDFISTGSSSNGLLLKLRTDSAVFLIKDGKREFLSYEVFTQRGYSFSDVIDVPSAIMNMFPELPRADFSFGTGTTSYAVTQGQTAEIVVTIQAINGFSSPITLYANDLPPGYNPVGTAWSPGTLTPVPVGPSFSTLRVATSSSTQVGTFPVTLRAVGGGLEKRIVIYLTVNSAASPTFSVEAFPTSATINQGERGVFVLTVRSVNGFNSQVHVAAIDLPAGYVPAGTQWTQEDVTPPANGSVAPTLTIVTDTATRTGTFPITLRATSGNITKETRVSLTINQYNPCGTSDEIRQSILRLTQFLGNNPVPEYLPGSSLLNYVHSFRLQSYDELYYTSVKLRGLANDSLTYASRTLSQGNLAAACKHYQRAERYKRLMIETETGAVDVWYTRVNNVSDIVRSVYDGSKAAVVFGLGVVPGVGPHAATVVDIAIVPLDYIVDKSMYGEEEAVRRRNENILNALISTVINELPLPQLKGKSIGRYIQDGVSHEVGASRIYSLLEAARHDPKFHQELVRQLSLVIGDLGTTAIERIASELEQAFVDGLQTTHAPSTVQAEELLAVVAASSAPAVVGTQPSNDAAFVSVNLSTITIDFSENVQAGSQSFTLKDSRGVSVPISSVSVSGGSMTVHLASNLARGTTYQASLQAGAVRNLSGIGNGQYAWSFTTSPPPISVGSAVVVSNTGGVGLRLRSTPAFLANGSNVITVLPEGTKLSVIGGPAQADGYTWWNVTGNSLTGWSATGDWLVPNDLAGLRVGAQVSVSNTSGVGLRLRKGPGLSEGIISTMPEGAQMTIISGPYYKDGYLWWNIRGGAGTGFSAVAYWLFPDAPATPTQTLTVASINPGSGVSVSVSPADNRGNYGG
ncbi:MAG TPA: Ig-like domain-containing protein, partial [Pyrinomonadaceae bacterium]|nr:Ig-like domain-containing protein [Pyrinomonadaceae bacterium]